jgi:hypothetical protein
MSKLEFELLNNAKLESDVSSYLQQGINTAASSVAINCSKGGEDLTKSVLVVLQQPTYSKMYQRAARDGKNPLCVVVTL